MDYNIFNNDNDLGLIHSTEDYLLCPFELIVDNAVAYEACINEKVLSLE